MPTDIRDENTPVDSGATPTIRRSLNNAVVHNGSRYNWSPAIITQDVKDAQTSSGSEYIPMIWGEKDVDPSRLANLEALSQSSHLLGFNEPNFGAQVHTDAHACMRCRVLAFSLPRSTR